MKRPRMLEGFAASDLPHSQSRKEPSGDDDRGLVRAPGWRARHRQMNGGSLTPRQVCAWGMSKMQRSLKSVDAKHRPYRSCPCAYLARTSENPFICAIPHAGGTLWTPEQESSWRGLNSFRLGSEGRPPAKPCQRCSAFHWSLAASVVPRLNLGIVSPLTNTDPQVIQTWPTPHRFSAGGRPVSAGQHRRRRHRYRSHTVGPQPPRSACRGGPSRWRPRPRHALRGVPAGDDPRRGSSVSRDDATGISDEICRRTGDHQHPMLQTFFSRTLDTNPIRRSPMSRAIRPVHC